MYIEPNTNIKIMKNVPLDNTFNHTILFANLNAQITYFSSASVVKHTLTKQSYQRVEKGKMRVQIQAENLYDCNYLAFQNQSFGTKWFYAFITGVEYVNNVTSEITFEIDPMQTYMFDITVGECFVEREHVTDDTIGANLIKEPIDCPEADIFDRYELTFEKWRVGFIVAPSIINVLAGWISRTALEVSMVPYSSDTTMVGDIQNGILHVVKDSAVKIQTVADLFRPQNLGEVRDNQFTGQTFYYTTTYMSLNEAQVISEIQQELDKLTALGATVLSMYQIPEEFISGFNVSPEFNVPVAMFEPVDRFWYTLDRSPYYYTPKNNKLKTAPYCYMKVINKQGGEMNLDFEKIHDKSFKYNCCYANGDVSCYLKNNKYGVNGISAGDSGNVMRLALNNFPTCSYNSTGVISKLVTLAQTLTLNLSKQVASASRTPSEPVQRRKGGANANRVWAESPQAYGKRLSDYEGKVQGAMIDNYTAELGQLANSTTDNMNFNDNSNGSPNVDVANDNFGYCVYRMAISGEYAKMIDNYFERFGYAVKVNKVPNMNTRPHWNYVKTTDAYITGNCPSDDLDAIIGMFNHGITFWKNPSEVGNYSLNNH